MRFREGDGALCQKCLGGVSLIPRPPFNTQRGVRYETRVVFGNQYPTSCMMLGQVFIPSSCVVAKISLPRYVPSSCVVAKVSLPRYVDGLLTNHYRCWH